MKKVTLGIVLSLSSGLLFAESTFVLTNHVLLRISADATRAADVLSARSTSIQIAKGWTFDPRGFETIGGARAATTSDLVQWGESRPSTAAAPSPKTLGEAWQMVHDLLTNASSIRGGFVIDRAEPAFSQLIRDTRDSRPAAPRVAPGDRPPLLPRPTPVKLVSGLNPHWPNGTNVGWHLDDAYSQLKSARETIAREGYMTNEVKAVLLDTGVRPNFAILPERYNYEAASNFVDAGSFPLDWASHGTATTAIFGGGRVIVKSLDQELLFEGYVGGNPWVDVTTHRINTSVVHFGNKAMALGIIAAANDGADVVSISHGGLPSGAWADAVDYAYERGTAIFAASGDYIELLFWRSPKQVVYPAAFSRVMAVPGITAARKSYGDGPSPWRLLTFKKWSAWALRGNYGPVWKMNNAVCGFAPNIFWAGEQADEIQIDGGGTSSSTPQVAAAASLWLQRHRNDEELKPAAAWRSAAKVEAVFNALRSSARLDGLPCQGQEQLRRFGHGMLSARDALSVPFKNLPPAPSAREELDYMIFLILELLMPDAFDLPVSRSMQPDTIPADLYAYGLEAFQALHRSNRGQRFAEKYFSAPGQRARGLRTSPKSESLKGDRKDLLRVLSDTKDLSRSLRAQIKSAKAGVD